MGNEKSVFGVIAVFMKSLFALLTATLSIADEAVAMADKTVRVAREKNAVELDLAMADYAEIAKVKAAHTHAKAWEELQEFVNKDPAKSEQRTKLVTANLERFEKIIARSQAEVALSRSQRHQ